MISQKVIISVVSVVSLCLIAYFVFNALFNSPDVSEKKTNKIKNIILILADDLGMKEKLIFQINRIMILTLLINLIHQGGQMSAMLKMMLSLQLLIDWLEKESFQIKFTLILCALRNSLILLFYPKISFFFIRCVLLDQELLL